MPLRTALAVLWLAGAPADAQQPEAPPSPPPAAAPPGGELKLGGYVEAFHGHNFNAPWNDQTAFRGFDNRHATITLSSVVLEAGWRSGDVSGVLALQAGHTPNTYYLFEPSQAGSASVPRSEPSDWRLLQRASVGYTPGGGRLTLEAGLFLSPLGPESMAVKDSWLWSRSTLFFALPFYHVGARAAFAASPRLTLGAAVYNGWNNVTDNNRDKSLCLNASYSSERWSAGAAYFGGVERARDAPEGRPWRHTFDAYATWNASASLALQVHVDGGVEPTHFGRTSWAGAALSARVRAASWLHAVARADVLKEDVGSGPDGSASPIFFPADRVASFTVGLDARPAERLSLRLELRRDDASAPLYFDDTPHGLRPPEPFAPTARRQNTLTLGLLGWF